MSAMRERGSVTAETAVALPALVVVLAAALWMIAAVNTQLRCVDAAREGARAAARGETVGAVREAVLRVAPAGSRVQIFRGAETVRVDVSAAVRPLWSSVLPFAKVDASAVSATESGVLP